VQPATRQRTAFDICGRGVVVFPERHEIAAPVRPLLDYWRDQCDGALPVPKARIDPLAMPPNILAHVLLVDDVPELADFRYRLIGTEITRFVGRDSTGRLLSEIPYPAEVRDRIARIYASVCRSCHVLYAEDPADWASKDFVRMATLLFPASRSGERVDLVFGAVMAVEKWQ